MDEKAIIELKFESIKKALNGLGSSFTDDSIRLSKDIQQKPIYSPKSVRLPNSHNSPKLERKQKNTEKDLKNNNEINQQLIRKIETLYLILRKQEEEIEDLKERVEGYTKKELYLQRTLIESENRELELKTELNTIKLLNSNLVAQNKNLSKLLVSRSSSPVQSSIENSSNNPKEQLTSKAKMTPKFNFNRLKIPDKLDSSEISAEPLTAPCDINYRTVCWEVMKVLGIKDVKEVVERVMRVRECSVKGRKCSKVLERILDVIIQSGIEGSNKSSKMKPDKNNV